ncbi:hypothetical protein CALVIDRAFT_492906, partial [Calocera viscosa TUFC12733]
GLGTRLFDLLLLLSSVRDCEISKTLRLPSAELSPVLPTKDAGRVPRRSRVCSACVTCCRSKGSRSNAFCAAPGRDYAQRETFQNIPKTG